MADWIAAIAAALSIFGGGFSWWRSELSSRARAEALKSEVAAAQKLEAVRKQADEAERLAAEVRELHATLAGPEIELHPVAGSQWQLVNRRTAELGIEAVVNMDDFARLDLPAMPFTLGAHAAVTMLAFGAWGKPIPAELVLRVTGRPDPAHVRIPRAS